MSEGHIDQVTPLSAASRKVTGLLRNRSHHHPKGDSPTCKRALCISSTLLRLHGARNLGHEVLEAPQMTDHGLGHVGAVRVESGES